MGPGDAVAGPKSGDGSGEPVDLSVAGSEVWKNSRLLRFSRTFVLSQKNLRVFIISHPYRYAMIEQR